jgi:3-hydroxyisobutyrate dehydrogenase-like beta-hydroxyacid dehydrogenase
MVRFAGKWLDMIKELLPVYAREIDSGDYSDAASAVRLFAEAAAQDAELTEETNVDTTWLAPLHDLVRRAVEAGHGDHSVSALTEMLRQPHPTA